MLEVHESCSRIMLNLFYCNLYALEITSLDNVVCLAVLEMFGRKSFILLIAFEKVVY